jgi:hypothetical protein
MHYWLAFSLNPRFRSVFLVFTLWQLNYASIGLSAPAFDESHCKVQNIGWELLDPNGSREESLLKFLTYAGHIRGLFIWTDIDRNYVATPGFLAAVLGAVPQLESLGFQGGAFDRGESEEICHQLIRDVSALPYLQSLRLEERYLRLSTAISLPQPLARLRQFSLSCDVITDVALESLLQHCPCLESLELGQCV